MGQQKSQNRFMGLHAELVRTDGPEKRERTKSKGLIISNSVFLHEDIELNQIITRNVTVLF